MDYHLERRLRLHAEPEHKSLYSWAINEIDENGALVGGDQIPWEWTLSFTATSCVLSDSIELKSEWQLDETTKPTKPEISQRQVIRIKLRTGHPRDNSDPFSRETKYSMFGTSRTVKDFQLDIHPISDPDKLESCRAWGSPSYTSEGADFRDETVDDCITFYMFVKMETFTRYAAMVSNDSIDEILFNVGLVDGFYSEWSPSISTSDVKVLTKGAEHKVEMPEDLGIEVPRLGSVGDAELYFNRRLEFGKGAPDEETEDKGYGDLDTVSIAQESRTPAAIADSSFLKIIVSLKRAAWWIVVLLVLIFLTMLLK